MEIKKSTKNFYVDLILYLKLEIIKYFKKGSIQNLYQIWEPMITYFEKML